jgi:hypothetical protein
VNNSEAISTTQTTINRNTVRANVNFTSQAPRCCRLEEGTLCAAMPPLPSLKKH